ncbi:GNAT family N-acetyltransferase [Streptomyces sp. NPDC001744]|uniref:GNAT family N-acetyltransferase n=1 Tax=Streptomyces sp. NPDC001744 TaxID=3364606 RepID=UPI0036B0C7B1
MTTPTPASGAHRAELRRVHGFLSAFHRRQAARTVGFPGGFAVFDDAYALSRGNNHVLVDGETGPEALPARIEALMGHLPYRHAYVLREEVAAACREPMARAGYRHSVTLLMRHKGPVPAHGGARETDLDALRGPVTASWRRIAPHASAAHVRDLVERRTARRRGAEDVRFLASRDADGAVAGWADLYLDPAGGVAQIEDLVTDGDHLGRGHAGAVLDTALHLAAGAGCATRFLTADPDDWPHRWYARRGFETIGAVSCFERDGTARAFASRDDT